MELFLYFPQITQNDAEKTSAEIIGICGTIFNSPADYAEKRRRKYQRKSARFAELLFLFLPGLHRITQKKYQRKSARSAGL